MEIQNVNSIHEVSAEAWNSLAGQSDPFIRHEFFSALELSGSVSAATGWQAQHLLVFDNGSLIAVCPLYLKFHSQGEFVFDHQWAKAFQQHDLQYYPKWLTSVPFTPCHGRRILVKSGIAEATVMSAIIDHLKQTEIASWHCLFCMPAQTLEFRKLGLLIREGIQFQWFNRGYRDFQDYCASFASRKRKTILKERHHIQALGIHFEHLTGSAITAQHWEVFFRFYQLTYLKHGMYAYLNIDFFKHLAASLPDSLLLILAVKDRDYVGAALSLLGADTLYGRYWGCLEEYPLLHFETCYYQGLDYCLANGLKRFESGAQGEHKIARGFEPVSTFSAHWIKDARFSDAIAQFLQREKPHIDAYKLECEKMLPFKQNQKTI